METTSYLRPVGGRSVGTSQPAEGPAGNNAAATWRSRKRRP
jgi:hypothetical protein